MNVNFKIFIEENPQNVPKTNISDIYEKLRIAINSQNEQSIYHLSKIITRLYLKNKNF